MVIKIKKKKPVSDNKILVGWNEWCSLPLLGLPAIKAKIDTGAKTSALHAFHISTFYKNEHKHVHFCIHPLQGDNKITQECEAPIIDERYIMSSNGHREHRYVISTDILFGNEKWQIELTLSNRDPLKFRMLLGREALNGRVIIDPNHTLCQGRIKKDELKAIYRRGGY